MGKRGTFHQAAAVQPFSTVASGHREEVPYWPQNRGHAASGLPHPLSPGTECSLQEQGRQEETQFLRQRPNNSRTDLIPHTTKGDFRDLTQLQVSTRMSNTKERD